MGCDRQDRRDAESDRSDASKMERVKQTHGRAYQT
jgi:hypothetical protein